jgi:hypothetical protein
MAMPQFQVPGGMPKVSPGQMQVKGPAMQMQGAHVSAQGPQAHMQAPKVQAPPPPHMQMQMPPIKMETPKIPAAQVKPPAGPNILLIVIWCLVAFLIGAVLMVLLLKPKQETPAPVKKGWNGGGEVQVVYAAIRTAERRLG